MYKPDDEPPENAAMPPVGVRNMDGRINNRDARANITRGRDTNCWALQFAFRIEKLPQRCFLDHEAPARLGDTCALVARLIAAPLYACEELLPLFAIRGLS